MQTHFDSTVTINGREVAIQITRLTRAEAIPFFTRFRHLRERTQRTEAQRKALTLALADDAQLDAIQQRESADEAAWGAYFEDALQYVRMPASALALDGDGPLSVEQLLAHLPVDVIGNLVTITRLENMLTDEAKKNWKLQRASAPGSSRPADGAPVGVTPAAAATSAGSSSTAPLGPVMASPASDRSGATAH